MREGPGRRPQERPGISSSHPITVQHSKRQHAASAAWLVLLRSATRVGIGVLGASIWFRAAYGVPGLTNKNWQKRDGARDRDGRVGQKGPPPTTPPLSSQAVIILFFLFMRGIYQLAVRDSPISYQSIKSIRRAPAREKGEGQIRSSSWKLEVSGSRKINETADANAHTLELPSNKGFDFLIFVTGMVLN